LGEDEEEELENEEITSKLQVGDLHPHSNFFASKTLMRKNSQFPPNLENGSPLPVSQWCFSCGASVDDKSTLIETFEVRIISLRGISTHPTSLLKCTNCDNPIRIDTLPVAAISVDNFTLLHTEIFVVHRIVRSKGVAADSALYEVLLFVLRRLGVSENEKIFTLATLRTIWVRGISLRDKLSLWCRCPASSKDAKLRICLNLVGDGVNDGSVNMEQSPALPTTEISIKHPLRSRVNQDLESGDNTYLSPPCPPSPKLFGVFICRSLGYERTMGVIALPEADQAAVREIAEIFIKLSELTSPADVERNRKEIALVYDSKKELISQIVNAAASAFHLVPESGMAHLRKTFPLSSTSSTIVLDQGDELDDSGNDNDVVPKNNRKRIRRLNEGDKRRFAKKFAANTDPRLDLAPNLLLDRDLGLFFFYYFLIFKIYSLGPQSQSEIESFGFVKFVDWRLLCPKLYVGPWPMFSSNGFSFLCTQFSRIMKCIAVRSMISTVMSVNDADDLMRIISQRKELAEIEKSSVLLKNLFLTKEDVDQILDWEAISLFLEHTKSPAVLLTLQHFAERIFGLANYLQKEFGPYNLNIVDPQPLDVRCPIELWAEFSPSQISQVKHPSLLIFGK